MKRKSTRKFAFGGTSNENEDGRKVKSVPSGYKLLKEDKVTGRKYYYMDTSTSLPAAASSSKSGDAKKYDQWLQQQLQNGVPVDELVNKKYISPTQSEKYSQYYKPKRDIVYIEPEKTEDDLPAIAFSGEPLYDTRGHATALIDENQRDSKSRSDGGMQNTAYKPARLMFLDNYGKIDSTKGYYEVPHDVFSNKYTNGYNVLRDTTGIQQYRKPVPYRKPKLAMGGDQFQKLDENQVSGYGSMISSVVNGINDVFQYRNQLEKQNMKQPIVNINSANNMISPYKFAFGGDDNDYSSLGLSQDDLQQLQEEADERGISLDELISEYQQGQQQGQNNYGQDDNYSDDYGNEDYEYPDAGDEDNEDDEYAYGGIHIKKANRGKFNALKKRTGKTTEQLTHSNNPLTRKRAIFAQNAAKWHHGFGGNTGKDINVEGNEIVEAPNQKPVKMVGPKHEQGGIDIKVPDGTKVFSDRLKVDNKSMQQRKEDRIKRMDKLTKLYGKNPNNLLKNTLNRTKAINDMEEQRDMMLQNVANRLYQAPTEKPKAAYGYDDYSYGDPYPIYNTFDKDKIKYWYKNQINPTNIESSINKPDSIMDKEMSLGPAGYNATASVQMNGTQSPGLSSSTGKSNNMTTGDWVGLGSNLVGAIAPFLNTIADKKHTPLVRNRYMGVGQRAINANDKAQDLVGRTRRDTMSDIDIAYNSAINRDRNSASSISVQRALDAAAELSRNNAINKSDSNYFSRMASILGQRGQLTNFQDIYQAKGQTEADMANQANTDNYYSNMASNIANLSNLGENVGRNLNTTKLNKDDRVLLNQLGMYVGLDDNDEIYGKN